MLRQIAQEGEGLWPQRNLLGSIPELGIGWIEAQRREEKDGLLFHRGSAWESLREMEEKSKQLCKNLLRSHRFSS